MADLEVSVAATGAKQAADDLARLANKTEVAAQANTQLATTQAKVTQAATQQAQAVKAVATQAQAAAQATQKQAQAAQAVGNAINRQAVAQERAQAVSQTAAKTVAAPAKEGRFAKVVGRLGGPLESVGGLGEVANLGPALGAAAAGAAIVGAGFKIAGALLDNFNKQLLIGVQAQINAEKVREQIQSSRDAMGAEVLKSQGPALIQLAGLGQTAKEVAARYATKAAGGAADAQQATLAAYNAPGVAGNPETLARVLDQSVELARLEGLSLKEATSKIIEAGGATAFGPEAIAAAVSEIEQRLVTTSMIVDRQARIAGDAQAASVMSGQAANGAADLAQQALLPQATKVGNDRFFAIQHPELAATQAIWKEASTQLAALTSALEKQREVFGGFVTFMDRLTKGSSSLSGQVRSAQDALSASGIDLVTTPSN